MTDFRIWRWGEYPQLFGWAHCNQKVLQGRGETGEAEKETEGECLRQDWFRRSNNIQKNTRQVQVRVQLVSLGRDSCRKVVM